MRKTDYGLSLLETLLAVVIAATGVFAMGAVAYIATTSSKNQGTESTRATIYAQDKIEGLMALAAVRAATTTVNFSDCTSSASTQETTHPSCNTTGISSTGWYTGLLAGGSTSPLQTSCPSAGSSNIGYMDFLDITGNQITGTSCPAVYTGSTHIGYIRQWQITDANTFGTTPALKQITVAVYSMSYVATVGARPIVVLTTYVSNPEP